MLNKILLNVFLFFGVSYSSLYIKEKVIWFEVIHKNARVLLNPPIAYPPTTDHLPNDPRTTDQPTHRLTDPTIIDLPITLFKSLEHKTFFYRIQTQLEKCKTILRVITFLNRIKVFDRILCLYWTFAHLLNICLSWRLVKKR